MLTVLTFMKRLNQPAGNERVTFTKVNIVSITFVRLLKVDCHPHYRNIDRLVISYLILT